MNCIMGHTELTGTRDLKLHHLVLFSVRFLHCEPSFSPLISSSSGEIAQYYITILLIQSLFTLTTPFLRATTMMTFLFHPSFCISKLAFCKEEFLFPQLLTNSLIYIFMESWVLILFIGL